MTAKISVFEKDFCPIFYIWNRMSFELTIEDIPHYSYKGYELWVGDWELIRGIPYSLLAWPNWKHQDVSGNFI